MADDIYKINLRLSTALGEQIKVQAAHAHRSINAQIEYILTTHLADDAAQRVMAMESALEHIEGEVVQLRQALTQHRSQTDRRPTDAEREGAAANRAERMLKQQGQAEAAMARGLPVEFDDEAVWNEDL